MKYGHAVLGESIELYNEADEWGRDQKNCFGRRNCGRAAFWCLKGMGYQWRKDNAWCRKDDLDCYSLASKNQYEKISLDKI